MVAETNVDAQRAWARIAGLMYLVTLIVDITGTQMASPTLSRALAFAGALCVIPLALGLYYTLKPVAPALAAAALGFRLLEASLGAVSTTSGFAAISERLAQTAPGVGVLHVAHWDHTASFSAFVFTIGSTIFFALFVRSRYLPRVLSWWGLFSSVVALAACTTHLVRPSYDAMTIAAWVPMLIGEISTGLWLLIKAVRIEPSPPAAASLPTATVLRAG